MREQSNCQKKLKQFEELNLTLRRKEKRAAERKKKLDSRYQRMEGQDIQYIQTAPEQSSSSLEDNSNAETEEVLLFKRFQEHPTFY